MRSYNSELTDTINLVSNKQTDQALKNLESNNAGSDKDLLYFFEKGELLRLNTRYEDSLSTWLEADHKVQEWESEAKIRMGQIAEDIGSVLVNDKVRRYDGHDYEKVMLSTQSTVDHLLQGDWDLARIEIKKTHEREAFIEELNAKETEQVEEQSKAKGVTATFKTLNGYPVQSLDTPEVNNLKNGYQSAYSHYLAGFVYEALNELSLAAPGYRKAVELVPNNPQLEEGLAGLDNRIRKRTPNQTDVLFAVESGVAPSLSSVTIPLPIMVSNIGVVPISFPVINSDPTRTIAPASLSLDGKQDLPLTTITSIDTMSRRALKDDMPGIIFRGVLRATAKAASQKALRDVGGYGQLAGIALNVVNVVTESADERTWRTLPASFSISRLSVPSGSHEFAVNGNKKTIDIKGSHAIVVARAIGNQVYWLEPHYNDKTPAYTPIELAPEPAPEPKKTKTGKHHKAKKS